MTHALDTFFESLSDADSDSTIFEFYGIDSKDMRKAALYARVSSDHQQKEGTIKSQVAELRRQITAAGHKVVKEYIDDGYTGADMDRPALEQMRQELKADVFDSIYFLCNDRIAREVAHQLIIVDELLKHGKRIIINGKDYEENPENKLSLTMFGAFAEFERAKIMERSKRGKLHRLRSGQVLGQGLSPYGYDYVSRSQASPAALVINEREATVVRQIFETFAGGSSICGIARSLEAQGIGTRHGRALWDATHLKTILQRHTYTGTRYYNTVTTVTLSSSSGSSSKNKRTTYRPKDRSEWIGVKVPPIVSQELFDNVQERLRQNKQRYLRPPIQHLLGGMLLCGECGSAMYLSRITYFDGLLIVAFDGLPSSASGSL
jgi:site-specific DNA recombinase